jgi:hypothetical protein
MRQHYPSDISREQFGLMLPILAGTRQKTAPAQWIDTSYAVACGRCSEAVASGGGCRALIPSGAPVNSYCPPWREAQADGLT